MQEFFGVEMETGPEIAKELLSYALCPAACMYHPAATRRFRSLV